LPSRRSNPQR